MRIWLYTLTAIFFFPPKIMGRFFGFCNSYCLFFYLFFRIFVPRDLRPALRISCFYEKL